MGFAACTNEVEEFAPQTQDKEFVGEELGKLTIDVTNSNFSADDAETRATLEKVGSKWIAKWGDNDAIGAAWFNRIKTNEGVVTHQASIYDADFGYGSNAIFNWKEGNQFTCEAVCMAGAYVLYYPYNLNATDDLTAIKVKEIGTPQTFKTSDVTEQVKANITAANVVSFRQGDDKLSPEFTVKQIPNLYALTFAIEDENLLKLGSTFKISRIYVEATKGDAPAINTDGIVGPEYPGDDYLANPDDKPSSFDYSISKDKWNNVDGEVLPEIDFVGGENKISRMQIDVTNDNKETEKGYWITALGKTTSKFYFSMLPTEDFDKLTIKVVGKMGKETKVFKAEYAGETYFNDLKAVMMSQGSALTLNVDLNIEDDIDDGIYDEAQFYEAWKAGQRTFNLATALNLVEVPAPKGVDFLNPEVKDAEGNVIADHVIFSGEKVTLTSIKGKYSFNNDVEINGNATITRCGLCSVADPHPAYGFNKSAHITQNLTVNSTGTGALNINGATTVDGNLVAEAGVNFTGKTTISGTATIKKGAYFATASTIKGDVTVEGGTLTCKALTIEKNLTINEGAEVKVASDKFITVKGNVNATGVITGLSNSNVNIEGVLTANANVTIGEAKIKDVIANKPVTIASVTEMGNLTANAAVTIEGAVAKMGNVEAKANVTVAGAVTAMGDLTTANNAAVSFGDAVTEMGDINAAEGTTVTFKKAVKAADITTDVDLYFPAAANANNITINKGTVTAKSTLTAKSIDVADKSAELYVTSNLLVEGKLTANGLVNAKSYTKTGTSIGELVIDDGITVTLNGKSATEKCVIGNLGINKEMTYFGTLVGDNIAVNGGENEGTINVPNFTINGGTFAQKGTFTGAITVAEGATLDVDANTNAAVTNNGTVNVAAGVSIIGAVVNNKTIELAGILNEENGAITLAEGSVVMMEDKANLKLTSTTGQKGEVNVRNGAIISYVKQPTIVSYDWTAVAPKDNGASQITAKINKYNLSDATLKNPVFNTNADIEASGIITFGSDVDFKTHKNNITFIGDTKFTAAKAYNVTLSSTNIVSDEKTLTVEKVVLAAGTIKLGTNAKFEGNKGSATITY